MNIESLDKKDISQLISFLEEMVDGRGIDLDSDDMRSTLYDHASDAQYFLEKLGVK